MKHNFLFLILLFLSTLAFLRSQGETGSHHRLLVVVSDVKSAEADSLRVLLAKDVTFVPDIRSWSEFLKRPGIITGYKIAWLHLTDTAVFAGGAIDQQITRDLQKFLDRGGSLFLTMEAFRMIPALTGDSVKPETIQKPSIDEGYGRKLGFHAFRSHPLFDGLNGGTYLYIPDRDMTVRVNGYFNNDVPSKCKVIGIDWDYIFFRENSKVVVETDYGKGKIVATGAYLYYARNNRHRLHLERFTLNTLRYLAGEEMESRPLYWYYGSPEVTACKAGPTYDRPFAGIPAGVEWTVSKDSLTIRLPRGGDDPFDVAGRRMLIMGHENGGIEEAWTYPFMAIRDLAAGFIYTGEDSVTWLTSLTPEIVITPSAFERSYRLPHGELTEIITADPEDPSGVVHFQYRGDRTLRLIIKFRSNLRYMWPYPETSAGTLCYGWNADFRAFSIADRSGEFRVLAGGNMEPAFHREGQDGSGFIITCSAGYDLAPGAVLDFVFSGTPEGPGKVMDQFERALREPGIIYQRASDHTQRLLSGKTLISTPLEDFNKGYRWALIGTDRFMAHTPGMGTSLVAGFATTRHGWDGGQKVSGRPGYAWYFGRDGQWSGFALLDYGDYEDVKSILRFYQAFQDLDGKIFHEATASGVIHYDAADATPLYILLAGRYFRYTNDTAFLRESWPYIMKAVRFCLSTDTDGDNLIENTMVGHGWVEGGELYGSHATMYLNGCWAEAIKEIAAMAAAMKEPDPSFYAQQSETIRQILNNEFWIARPVLGGPGFEAGYFSYGKNLDGTFRKEITVLPSVPLLFGLADPSRARAMFSYWEGNTFSTAWGTRIIGDDSPLFKPTGYHYGSVWPLFTGWTSLAEYRYGYSIQGFTHLMNNLDVYRNWAKGFVEEVLNGAEYKPSGVCSHQCWSETMVLQPALEGLLGYRPDVPGNHIKMAPSLPADWDSMTVTRLRFGDKTFNFRFSRNNNVATYTFEPEFKGPVSLEFMPSFPPGTILKKALINGKELPVSSVVNGEQLSALLPVTLEGNTTLDIEFKRGISVLPLVYHPAPGQEAAGPRILDVKLANSDYFIFIEGKPGTTATFRVYAGDTPVTSVENGQIRDRNNQVITVEVSFDPSEAMYSAKNVIIHTN